jgi:hypothetical protein
MFDPDTDENEGEMVEWDDLLPEWLRFRGMKLNRIAMREIDGSIHRGGSAPPP